jgi:uncharacterized protein
MKPVFAGTSYYLALVNPVEPWHKLALELAENLLGRTVVTQYVLVELGSALSLGSNRLVYLELLDRVGSDSATTIIPATGALFQQGVALFSKRTDKDRSLANCISLVVMKEHRLKEALTTDRHFVEAGFRALLLGGERP